MASAASSVGSAVVGICPVKAGSGSFQPVPIPSDRPAVWSWSALRRDASPMKAVLHDRAKSTGKGTVPEVSPSKLVKVLPPTVTLGALLSVGLMTGAIGAHLTKLGIVVRDDGGVLFGLAATVFVCSAAVLVIRRRQIPVLGYLFVPTGQLSSQH